jgi:hypothetical protein
MAHGPGSPGAELGPFAVSQARANPQAVLSSCRPGIITMTASGPGDTVAVTPRDGTVTRSSGSESG